MGIESVKSLSVKSSSVKGMGYMSSDPRTRLKQAGHALEATFLSRVLKEAQPKGSKTSFAESTFQDMMSDTLSQKMAESNVLGLADLMVNQTLRAEVEAVDPKTLTSLKAMAPNTSITPATIDTNIVKTPPNTSVLPEGQYVPQNTPVKAVPLPPTASELERISSATNTL